MTTTLPRKPLPRSTVTIEGQLIEVRGLSRSEALHLNTAFRKGDEIDADEAEVYILACGTGASEDEARAFRNEVDTETAGLVIDEILSISGLTPGPGGPDPKTSGRKPS